MQAMAVSMRQKYGHPAVVGPDRQAQAPLCCSVFFDIGLPVSAASSRLRTGYNVAQPVRGLSKDRRASK